MTTPPESFEPPNDRPPRRRAPPGRDSEDDGFEYRPTDPLPKFGGPDFEADIERPRASPRRDEDSAAGTPEQADEDAAAVERLPEGVENPGAEMEPKKSWLGRKAKSPGGIGAGIATVAAALAAIPKTSSFFKALDAGDAINGLWESSLARLLCVLAIATAFGAWQLRGKRVTGIARGVIWSSILASLVFVTVLLVLDVREGSGDDVKLEIEEPEPEPRVLKPDGSFNYRLRGRTLTTGSTGVFGVTLSNKLIEFPQDQLATGGSKLPVRVVTTLREDTINDVTRPIKDITGMVQCDNRLFVASNTGWIRGYLPTSGERVNRRDLAPHKEVELYCVRQLADRPPRHPRRPRLLAVRPEQAEVLRLDTRTELMDRLSDWVGIHEKDYEGDADIDAVAAPKGFVYFSDRGRELVQVLTELNMEVELTIDGVADAQTLIPVGSRVVAAQPSRNCASIIDSAEDVTHRVSMSSSRSFGGAHDGFVYLVDQGGELTIIDVANPDPVSKHFHVADTPSAAAITENGDLLVVTDDRVDLFWRESLMEARDAAWAIWNPTKACNAEAAPSRR